MKIVTSFCRILVATTIVGVLLAAAVPNTTAQTNDYLVKIKGATQSDGGKVKLTENSFHGGTDVIVLRIIKNPPRSIQLQKRDASTTNTIAILITSFREAFLADGQFSSNLEQSDPSYEADGELVITGKESPATNPTKVKASLIGVDNDGVHSAASDIDSLFKGTLTGTRLPLVP